MISLYSGTPGSGKSLDVAHLVYRWIRQYKSNVICVNMSVYRDFLYEKHKQKKINNLFGKKILNDKLDRKQRGVLYTLSNFDMISPEFFYDYAMKFHKPKKEHQTLIVIDEAQMFFNPSIVKEFNSQSQEYKKRKLDFKLNEKSKYAYKDTYRKDWLEFFTHHRHLGFDIVLVSQFDKLIDAQVRCVFEYNHIHRKVNNFSWGFLFSLFGISVFLRVTRWYNCNLKCGQSFFLYSKKYSKVYDSYRLYDEIFNRKNEQKEKDKLICDSEALGTN